MLVYLELHLLRGLMPHSLQESMTAGFADRHHGGRHVHASPAGFLGQLQGGRQQVLEWDYIGVMRTLEWGKKSQAERWGTAQCKLHWSIDWPGQSARISLLSFGADAPGLQSHGQWWQGFKGGCTGLTRNMHTNKVEGHLGIPVG